MMKTRKLMRIVEQQTTEMHEQPFEIHTKNYSLQKQNRKQEKIKYNYLPKVDNFLNKDPFLNTLKLTTLDLVQNFDYMDPNDVTFQLNEMAKQKSFIQQTKPFNRIHQRSMPKQRSNNKYLFELSRTTRIN
ncbi:unnamed protein product (macronuclear) [Paramecium tetraurelia]|uniref:Uncharacterized protein n=1 Tax=Paramecium tetraurelia TaxID=5888 RepID=A0BBP0_PARTE|nr:uncharacterized protein GSPATT00000392001 [Paramecium tetraurelia]CAK55957.1 unnamed protein product [Paramecium tetraurelia]|eukprot:XP_001423355.1 hypothetical protein (macronuclear) [Paramecium tetraurelia strain d4-2]